MSYIRSPCFWLVDYIYLLIETEDPCSAESWSGMGVLGVIEGVADEAFLLHLKGGELRMKEHSDLITGILVGTVLGGMYAPHLATILPIAFGLLVVVYGLKFLSLK